MSEANDQPVAEETPAPGVVTEAPAATDDINTDAFDRMPAPDDEEDAEPEGDGEASEATGKPALEDAETVEIELNGKKYTVPKDIAPAVMKDADYTQKTQAVAALRREVDERAAALATKESQQAESLRTFRNEHLAVAQGEASLAQLNTELAPYRKLTPQDWATLRAQDPANYQHHSDQYEFLRRTLTSTEDGLTVAKKDLTDKEAKHSSDQQTARTAGQAKAWEETHATLQKEVKDWTPDRFKVAARLAHEKFGYNQAELEQATDPRAWKMAVTILDQTAEIDKLKSALKQQTTTQNNVKAQVVQPAERPRGNSQPTKPTDGISTSDWMRRRDAQVAKRRS